MAHHNLRGRGAAHDPPNRFLPVFLEREEWRSPEDPGPATRFFRDTARSVITRNESPDVGFTASLNPYRGCENGCPYCYARPTHEFLGLSAGLDFETKIFVKEDAPELLRRELTSPGWTPEVLVLSGVTDPYQPIERRVRVTRRCLEVLAEFRNPVAIITKSHLVTRDIDLLQELSGHRAASVTLSVTTLRRELQRIMEPRTSTPERRLEAIRKLSAAGVPVAVNVAPVIPGLTDHELPRILQQAAQAGATQAGYVMLRLPHAVRELFVDWLERHFPERKEKVLNRLRDLRGGDLYDARYGVRMRGEGPFAEQVRQLFELGCRKAGLERRTFDLSIRAFRCPPKGGQLAIFDES